MALLSTSAPIGLSAKDSLEPSDWIDFGNIDTVDIVDEKELRACSSNMGTADGAENRDEQHIIFGNFENFDDEYRDEPRTLEANTPGSRNSVVQKWDTFIRASHHDENVGNQIELDTTGENSSRLHKTRSVGVLTNKSLASKPKKDRRSFGLGDITNQSVASKPIKQPRSFGLEDFDKLFPTSVTDQISSDISKLALQDFGSNERASQESTNTKDQSQEISSPKADASHDSDGSEIKKLISLWNRRSPTQGKRLFSTGSPANKENTVKTASNGSGDSENPIDVESEIVMNAENRKGDKLTIVNTQPMRALVILEQPDTIDLVIGEAIQKNNGEEQLVIRNLTRTTESMECECSRSAFSGNEDLISFFLPQMGTACTCGRNNNGKTKLIKPDDPTALENILRPWQVDFLKSFDIHRGEEFVKARRRSPSILARGLRQWRKKNDMTAFKTNSCATALEIWAKVCKSYVRSIRRQTLAGEENLPADASMAQEMSSFLGDLPTAPKRRAPKDTFDIDPESQFEV